MKEECTEARDQTPLPWLPCSIPLAMRRKLRGIQNVVLTASQGLEESL